MRWSWKYAFITLLLFCVEVCIALYVHDNFIRPFIGDLLVVVLLYTGLRTVFKAAPLKIAIVVAVFAIGMEFLQFLNIVERLGLQDNTLARIVIGTTFDWLDILAYLLGVVLVYILDTKVNTSNAPQ